MMAGSGLEKRAIVSTLLLKLVLREKKVQVLAPACHLTNGRVSCFCVEGLDKIKERVKSEVCDV